jgi:hypothetical protein
MSPSTAKGATKFTLRFRSARTHEMLGLVADGLGMSKNQLAEQMLERELEAAALSLEQDLAGSLALVRSYNRDTDVERHIQAFAEGEAFGEDPVRSTAGSTVVLGQDALGIADVFSR